MSLILLIMVVLGTLFWLVNRGFAEVGEMFDGMLLSESLFVIGMITLLIIWLV